MKTVVPSQPALRVCDRCGLVLFREEAGTCADCLAAPSVPLPSVLAPAPIAPPREEAAAPVMTGLCDTFDECLAERRAAGTGKEGCPPCRRSLGSLDISSLKVDLKIEQFES